MRPLSSLLWANFGLSFVFDSHHKKGDAYIVIFEKIKIHNNHGTYAVGLKRPTKSELRPPRTLKMYILIEEG
jgi:hypothetical protein